LPGYFENIELKAGETLDLVSGDIRNEKNEVVSLALHRINDKGYQRVNIEEGSRVNIVRDVKTGEGLKEISEVIQYKYDERGQLLLEENTFDRKYYYDEDANHLRPMQYDPLAATKEPIFITYKSDNKGDISIGAIRNGGVQSSGILPPGAKAIKLDVQQREDDSLDITISQIQLKDGRTFEIVDQNSKLAKSTDSDRMFYFEKFTGEWEEKAPQAVTDFDKVKANGWEILDIVPRQLSTVDKREGLKATDLILVHRTDYLPENGIIETRMRATGQTVRDTIHFTLNHPVSGHMFGNWDDKPYTILIPLTSIPKSKIEGFNLIDTWVRGNLELPEGAIVLGTKLLPEGVNLGKAQFRQISAGDENIEKEIAELGYTPTKGGMWSWYGDSWEWTGRQMELAEKEGLDQGAHSNHWSSGLEEHLLDENYFVYDSGAIDINRVSHYFSKDSEKKMPVFAKATSVDIFPSESTNPLPS